MFRFRQNSQTPLTREEAKKIMLKKLPLIILGVVVLIILFWLMR